MTARGPSSRDDQARAALYRARVLVNRTPHFTTNGRREANRALDLLDSQLGRNQVSLSESVRGLELLNRSHSSIAFALLCNAAFVDRFGAAIRHLGLRGIEQRLDEIPHSVMAQPISGPIGGRLHRDDLVEAERTDASGRPLPPPPGYY